MRRETLSKEREGRIADLHCRLEAARRIQLKNLAAQIRNIGFHCLRCGECCTGEHNSVVVFPFEIERILETMGLNWLETVEAPTEGEWDREGNFHTLEWRIKKENGSCRFHSGRGCSIYQDRPLLCGTYPFYLDDGSLCCSECRGLGLEIDPGEADRIAIQLVERHITELEEAIALLEKYEDFERGRPSAEGDCVVHDSRGTHRIHGANLLHGL